MTVYRLVLPFERPPMTANQARASSHWAPQARAKAEVEKAVWAVAKQHKVPRLEKCAAALTWFPPDDWRDRDADGLGVMVKACLDGLIKAKVLRDDASAYVAGVLLRVAEPDGRPRVELALVDSTGPGCFAELIAA